MTALGSAFYKSLLHIYNCFIDKTMVTVPWTNTEVFLLYVTYLCLHLVNATFWCTDFLMYEFMNCLQIPQTKFSSELISFQVVYLGSTHLSLVDMISF